MAMKSASKGKKSAVAVSENAFAGRASKPTERDLKTVLGGSYALWKQVVSELREELKLDGADWHTASVKYGWSFRLRLTQRNIVYLGPRNGFFVAAFVLGDKAVIALRNTDLPADLLHTIAQTKRYAEGTPVRIDVSSRDDLDVVKIIARIKLEN
jgi:hypothetical protein